MPIGQRIRREPTSGGRSRPSFPGYGGSRVGHSPSTEHLPFDGALALEGAFAIEEALALDEALALINAWDAVLFRQVLSRQVPE
jgi:hypothetical protein